jgi:hypothetical protein
MFGFLSFLLLLVIAYLLWRVTDQLPDLIFRMSEIQRDVAEIRRARSGGSTAAAKPTSSAPEAAASSTAAAGTAAPASTGSSDTPASEST